VVERALATAEAAADWRADALEVLYRALAEEMGLKTGQLFGTIRTAITGRTATPPLFDTMSVLGRDRVRSRLRAALA
jgi:glutamyl-tRNA synthetase